MLGESCKCQPYDNPKTRLVFYVDEHITLSLDYIHHLNNTGATGMEKTTFKIWKAQESLVLLEWRSVQKHGGYF